MKKLHVVYDDKGTILAAAERPGQDRGFDVPLSEPGERAAEYDLPAELADRELHELVPQLQIDVKENRLVERR